MQGAMKNMGTTGLKKAVAQDRGKPSPYAAKPSIPVKNGTGMSGSMSLGMGKACKSLKRMSEGRGGPR